MLRSSFIEGEQRYCLYPDICDLSLSFADKERVAETRSYSDLLEWLCNRSSFKLNYVKAASMIVIIAR